MELGLGPMARGPEEPGSAGIEYLKEHWETQNQQGVTYDFDITRDYTRADQSTGEVRWRGGKDQAAGGMNVMALPGQKDPSVALLNAQGETYKTVTFKKDGSFEEKTVDGMQGQNSEVESFYLKSEAGHCFDLKAGDQSFLVYRLGEGTLLLDSNTSNPDKRDLGDWQMTVKAGFNSDVEILGLNPRNENVFVRKGTSREGMLLQTATQVSKQLSGKESGAVNTYTEFLDRPPKEWAGTSREERQATLNAELLAERGTAFTPELIGAMGLSHPDAAERLAPAMNEVFRSYTAAKGEDGLTPDATMAKDFVTWINEVASKGKMPDLIDLSKALADENGTSYTAIEEGKKDKNEGWSKTVACWAYNLHWDPDNPAEFRMLADYKGIPNIR